MKNQNAVEFISPVGRLVQGNLFKPTNTDMYGRPLLDKSGKPRVNYFISVAIPKKDASMNNGQLIPSKSISGGYVLNWALVFSVASKLFPSYFQNGKCMHPNFSFKITDGDSELPNAKGIKPKDRDGWAGCWVVRFNNGFAPKIFTKGGASAITDPNAIKAGYWIRVHGTCVGNNNMEKPGVFLNMMSIELVGYGDEIKFGDSGDAFGADPADLPEGATAIPAESNAFASNISPSSVTPPPFPTNVTPAPDFLNPPPAPAATVPPPPPSSSSTMPPPVPPVMRYLANGRAYTADELKKGGWTDALIATLPKA
ncbi:MAG: DUF2815 family protein [Ignavibacteria bacterium]|nr:DUF2815 family protein [Ignavibacteria bacterium]